MQAEKSQEDQGTKGQAPSVFAVAAPPAAVQGVPWWGGVGHAQGLQNTSSTATPLGFATPLPAQQTQALPDGADGGSGVDANNEIQLHIGAPAVIPAGVRDYVLPHTHLELGHTLAPTAYPYADPYFGGMVAAYGTHAMMYPHIMGLHQSRMPLPSEITEEEPVYVNAKQYNGIMRRRQSRAKAESENKLLKARKPYLHESRHLHAMRRARGCGGRFLNTNSKASSDSTRSSEGHSSQEGSTPDSKKSGQGFKSCAVQEVEGTKASMNGASFAPGVIDEGDFGRNGGVMAQSSHQRVMAMQ